MAADMDRIEDLLSVGRDEILSGRLIGVRGLKQFYQHDLDRSQHGLREVAQLDTYKGFGFATMDETAPPLLEYLDDGTGPAAQ